MAEAATARRAVSRAPPSLPPRTSGDSTHVINVRSLKFKANRKGPLPPAFGGYKFSITYICEKSKHSYTYLMKKKSESSAKLEEFLNDIKLDGYAPPKEVRTDAGSGIL